jgi:hypothetical protein
MSAFRRLKQEDKRVQGQLGLHTKTLCKKNKQIKIKRML